MAAAAAISLAALVAGFLSGCGDGTDPAGRLEESRRAVQEYVQGGGYLHFRQEKDYRLEQAGMALEQKIYIEGDSIFPSRQRYEYRETASGSQSPGSPQENAFSYLTLDGGATAFVEGKRLSEQTGVVGWVHYTPPVGQNRYFDLPAFLAALAAPSPQVEEAGREEIAGTPCTRLRYSVSGEQLFEMRLSEDPTLRETYGDVDLSRLAGDLTVEIWIGDGDNLPRRVTVQESLSLQEGGSSSSYIRIELSGYGEEPPLFIEQPAFFTETK